MKDKSWLGINLGGLGMDVDDDLITFQADGQESKFYDQTSRGKNRPIVDVESNLTGTFDVVGNEVIFRVNRKLDTGDQGDFLVPIDTEFNMAWAVRTTDPFILSRHNKRGPIPNVSLASDGSPTWKPADPAEDEKDKKENEKPTDKEEIKANTNDNKEDKK